MKPQTGYYFDAGLRRADVSSTAMICRLMPVMREKSGLRLLKDYQFLYDRIMQMNKYIIPQFMWSVEENTDHGVLLSANTCKGEANTCKGGGLIFS